MSRQASNGGTSGSGPSSAGSSLAEWAHWTSPKPGSYSCWGRPAVQLSLSFWLEEVSAREPAPLSLGQAETETSPRPLEEGGSRFQAAQEPVTGFMLMRALPAPALSLFPGPARQLNYAAARLGLRSTVP